MANGTFSWLSLSTAIQQLGQRLNVVPSSTTLWSEAELSIYITTALRQWNSLTWKWRQDFAFSSNSVWNSLGSLAGSPRIRTITDTDCYTEMEYMLLEPPSGSVWTGTNQFDISVFSQALQRRRDEMIQIGNLNQDLLTGIAVSPNTVITQLPDTVIDVERVRYLATMASTTGTATIGVQTINVASTLGIATGQLVSGAGISYYSTVTSIGSGTVNISIPTIGPVSGQINFFTPNTLYRDDTVANEFYEVPLYQQAPGTPQTFSLSSEPPLSWQVDVPPNLPGTYEAIVLQSGVPFNPPASTLIGIPDDLSYVLQWGALADLLSQEPESTDLERADYCTRRYQDGIKTMLNSPWIELGKVNGQAVSVDSIVDLDRYEPNWDANPMTFGPVIVSGGMDWIAAPVMQGIGVTVLANAPITDSNGNLQVSRSDWDAVILLAQSRAMFKLCGADWKAGLELEKQAILAASAENSRLKSQGAYSDILDQRGNAQERAMNRYNDFNQK